MDRAPNHSRDQRKRFAPANPAHNGRRAGSARGGPARAPRIRHTPGERPASESDAKKGRDDRGQTHSHNKLHPLQSTECILSAERMEKIRSGFPRSAGPCEMRLILILLMASPLSSRKCPYLQLDYYLSWQRLPLASASFLVAGTTFQIVSTGPVYPNDRA